MKKTVNLDAMVLREDFKVDDGFLMIPVRLQSRANSFSAGVPLMGLANSISFFKSSTVNYTVIIADGTLR